MRNITTIIVAGLLLSGVAEHVAAQDVGLKWFRDFGSSRDSEFGTAIHTDEAGYIYTTGFVGDMVDFNRRGTPPVVSGYPSNSGDAFVTKHSPDGDLIWVRTMVGAGTEKGNDVTTDRFGNVYVVGNFRGTTTFNPGGVPAASHAAVGGADMFITKYDNNGVFQWVKVFGTASEEDAVGVVTDSAGNVYIAGSYMGDINFGGIALTSPGIQYILIAKLDPQGNVVWAHGLGTGGARGTQHAANKITIDETQNLYITGVFTETVDFNPSPSATYNMTSGGGTDAFVLKLTKDGDFVWAQSMEGPKSGTGMDIQADGMGSVYVVGWFVDSININQSGNKYTLRSNALGDGWNGYLMKFDTNGTYRWGFPIGARQSTQAIGVHTDRSGNVYVTGQYDDIVDFDPDPVKTALREPVKGPDIFVARYSPAGEYVWAKTAGGPGDDLGPNTSAPADAGLGVAVDTGFNVYVTGYYQGTVDFDPGPDTAAYTTAGRTDVFIWKLRCPAVESVTVISELCSSSYVWNEREYTESGTYTKEFYLGEGCDSVAVLELTLGEAIEKPIISVQEYTLSVRSGYASYQWLLNGAKIDGATDSVYVVDKNGTYAVVVSNARNCVDTSDEYMVNNVSVAGMQPFGSVKLAPNPARNEVYVSGVVPAQVHITTLDGRSVKTIDGKAQLYIGDLPGGVYLVSVYGENGLILLREKLIKLD